MGDIDIRPVRTAGQRNDFLRAPYQINAGRPLWVPPLRVEHRREMDPRHNPFYEHGEAELFVAYRGDRAVGRIAAIENRLHNRSWNDRVGFFGHYEALDDLQISRRLFAAAASWLAARGMDRMRGPTNPSMNTSAGFLTEGFQYPPTIPMPYTQPYYPAQAEDYGLVKAMELVVYGWNFDSYTPEFFENRVGRVRRLAERVARRTKIVVRGPRRDQVDRELLAIREICNESLKDNWGFVPLTDGEMQAARRELETVIDEDLFFIAEIDGRPQAVFLACPDYNRLLARMNGRILPLGWLTYLRHRKRIRNYVVYVYATTPRAEAMGVAPLLYRAYFDACVRKGIKDCETGYVLEVNRLMRSTIEKLGAELRKRYHVYEKAIGTVSG